MTSHQVIKDQPPIDQSDKNELKTEPEVATEQVKKVQQQVSSSVLEDLDDFKLFKLTLNVKKPSLLPLEVQMQIEREKRQAEEYERNQEKINLAKIKFLQATEQGCSDDELLNQIDQYQNEMEGADAEEAFARAPPKTNNRNNKKSMKLSSKVAPLVAALNEQAAQKGLSHLSEQEQLLRKNKKKANQLTRKQKQKQKKRDDKQAKQNATKHGGQQDLDDDQSTNNDYDGHQMQQRKHDNQYGHNHTSHLNSFDKK